MRFGPTKLIATTLAAKVACLDSTDSMQEDRTTLQKIIELEELILELQIQAARSVEILEVFDSNLEALLGLQQSKQNIEQLKRKNMRLPSAPRIKKSWRVKPTIRGRLPFY